MSARISSPYDERPNDARLKQIARVLEWMSTCGLCLAVPVCMARFPHYLTIALAAFACSGAYISFLLAIKIGQRLHLVGSKLVLDKPSTVEDEFEAPIRKIVPIQRDVMQDEALGGLHAEEVAKTHHVDVAGIGRVTYWLADRRG